jgi:hypothetical protein
MNDDNNIGDLKTLLFFRQWFRENWSNLPFLAGSVIVFFYSSYYIILGCLRHHPYHEILRFFGLEFYVVALVTGLFGNSIKKENLQLRVIIWWMSRLILFLSVGIYGYSFSS